MCTSTREVVQWYSGGAVRRRAQIAFYYTQMLYKYTNTYCLHIYTTAEWQADLS